MISDLGEKLGLIGWAEETNPKIIERRRRETNRKTRLAIAKSRASGMCMECGGKIPRGKPAGPAFCSKRCMVVNVVKRRIDFGLDPTESVYSFSETEAYMWQALERECRLEDSGRSEMDEAQLIQEDTENERKLAGALKALAEQDRKESASWWFKGRRTESERNLDQMMLDGYNFPTNSRSANIPRRLRKSVLRIKGIKCERCPFDKLHPRTKTPVVMVHHVDGDAKNNTLKNLEVLCPNCHAMTDTYAGHNRGKSTRIHRRQGLDVFMDQIISPMIERRRRAAQESAQCQN